ncbi:MAG: hypothetical protein K2R98_00400 [Gemmataceae bacterium]|nr:hypothetical protein [Gemmataceae bacterium]
MLRSLLVIAYLANFTLAARADEPARPEPPALPPELVDVLKKGAAAWDHATPEQRQQIAQQFREHLPEIRGAVETPVYNKLKARHAVAWQPIEDAVVGLICAGPLLLFTPLLFFRRYPGKFHVLCAYSLLAAGLFSLTVALFYGPLYALSSLWEELAMGVDPRLRTMDAAFDLMDQNAEEFLSRDLPLGSTLEQVAGGRADSFVTVLLQNLSQISDQFAVLEPLVTFYRRLDWLFGSLPKIQCLLFALLFVIPLYPIFKAIVQLPLHACEGEPREGRRVAKLALRNWWREVLALFGFLLIWILIVIGNDMVLTSVAEPGTESMLNLLFVALDYLGHEPAPSYLLLYSSLAAVGLFYLFNIVVMTLAVMLYLNWALRILRLRFHQKQALWSHAPFWKWGTLSMIWVQLLPLLFIYLAWPGIQAAVRGFAHDNPPNYLGALVAGGAAMFLGILVVFWLARGFRALGFLIRYRVPMAKIALQ